MLGVRTRLSRARLRFAIEFPKCPPGKRSISKK
jgi:hypothetical protein